MKGTSNCFAHYSDLAQRCKSYENERYILLVYEGSYFFFRCKLSKNENYIQLSLLKGKDFLTIKQKFIIHQLILK